MKANDILNDAEPLHERVKPHLRDAADWFHDHEGEMFKRDDAAEKLSSNLNITKDVARDVIRSLVGDLVDPVVQIQNSGNKYIGVAEYETRDGAYIYLDYDDTIGDRYRAVCAQCVHEATHDTDVTHATAGEGTFSNDVDVEELYNAITEHYKNHHDVVPSNVETGASLLSGTTIGGNTAFHAGNDGSGSGLNADFLDGQGAADVGTDPFYGDGSDGFISRSASGNENGVITASDYTVQSGVHLDVTTGFLIVTAQNKITINGTLDATGYGGSGGAGGISSGFEDDFDGESGNNGYVHPTGNGGGGGSSLGGSSGYGGSGGSGDTTPQPKRSEILTADIMSTVFDISESTFEAGAGGGGGGAGGGNTAGSTASGGDGGLYGGGGGGGQTNSTDAGGGDGGDGGNGGGVIVLMAPKIEINGTVTAAGQNGGNGGVANGIGGGGGGGGSGGVIAMASRDFTDAGGYDVSGGSGGSFGNGSTIDGGNGARGQDGTFVKYEI